MAETIVKIENLVAGIHRSVAKRVAALAFRNGIVQAVAMSGGVALNKGVVALLSQELKSEILVHEDCQLAGALGAAVLAASAGEGARAATPSDAVMARTRAAVSGRRATVMVTLLGV